MKQKTVPFKALFPFLLITFGIAWGILAFFILFPEPAAALLGALTGEHPMFILAVWSPAIAAFIITRHYAGAAGLRAYLSSLTLWRCPVAWYGFLAVGIPLLFYAGAVLKGESFTGALPVTSVHMLITAFVYTAIKGPIEEFGWRGLALPLLQQKMPPVWAGLVLGIIWGFWHLPAFLLSGTPQSAWSFTPFFIGAIALSLIVTPLFNASHGSILLSALFHFQCNNPLWPDAQPYDTIFFASTAIVIVFINRKTMFRRTSAVTTIAAAAPSHRIRSIR